MSAELTTEKKKNHTFNRMDNFVVLLKFQFLQVGLSTFSKSNFLSGFSFVLSFQHICPGLCLTTRDCGSCW